MSEHQIINAILPGDIVFDIGANAGDKADWFLKRGARVVCVEPQPAMIEILKKKFDDQDAVRIVGKAVGTRAGKLPMSICREAPTLSTLTETWKQGRFAEQKWDEVVEVEVTTLDALIAQFGTPRYTKVDVEGFEKQVLGGLTTRAGIISFEFTSEFIKEALHIVERLIALGYRNFNLSLGENPAFALPQWVPYYELVPLLMQNTAQHTMLWGDIYAN